MNYKHLFFICALTVQVTCECDGYIECFGDFVKNFLGDRNVTKISDDNSTDFKEERNNSISVFDITQIGKSFNQALVDVTSYFKEELSGMFNFDQEFDEHKDLNNDTEIHVKAFGISRIKDESENFTDIIIPDILVNNFTEFNDDFEALKEEIEKNLQAELEAFISKITENDTLDWEYVIETEQRKSEIKKPIQEIPIVFNDIITTQKTGQDEENNDVTTTSSPIKQTSDMNTSAVFNRTTKSKTDNILTNTSNENSTSTSSTVNYFSSVDVKIDTTTEEAEIVSTTINDDTSKSRIDIVVSTPTPFTITTNYVTNKSAIISTEKTDTEASTSKPIASKSDSKKPVSQKKSPIDFKLLENIKLNEISKEDMSYYDVQDDNATDYPIIDYVDLYKDTTNEDIEYKPTEINAIDIKTDLDNVIEKEDSLGNFGLDNGYYLNDTSNPASIFPWIATIFIKDSTNNQFDYYCDGVLLSSTLVLTAGRCVTPLNVTVNPEDILVFLGKRSLQSSGEDEEIHRVKKIVLHENFTSSDGAVNDLAVIQLEEPAEFTDRIQAACLLGEEGDEAVTTAWDASLSIIRFVEKNKNCEKNPLENTFCATFGDAVALCPSYGGAYAVKTPDSWCIRGLRTADPSSRGYCLDKTVAFTDLVKYKSWIYEMLK